MSEEKHSYHLNTAVLAVVLSLIALLLLLWMADFWTCPQSATGPDRLKVCNDRLHWFVQLPPNEQGDALAGVAGTFAFLGILATIWMQSRELKAQRHELELTRIEYAEQRKATQNMAKAMQVQTDMLIEESKVRRQKKVSDEVQELLLSIVVLAQTSQFAEWVFEKQILLGGSNYTLAKESYDLLPRSLPEEKSDEAKIIAIAQNMAMLENNLQAFFDGTVDSNGVKTVVEICKTPSKNEYVFEGLKALLCQIESRRDDLSTADKERLWRCGFPILYSSFFYIYDCDAYESSGAIRETFD